MSQEISRPSQMKRDTRVVLQGPPLVLEEKLGPSGGTFHPALVNFTDAILTSFSTAVSVVTFQC